MPSILAPIARITVAAAAVAVCGCQLAGAIVQMALPYAGIKLALSCVPAKTAIDTPTGPRAIEKLEAGDLVIGYAGQPVRILQKHSYLESPQTEFLRVTFTDGAVVDLCKMHRIAGVRSGELNLGQTITGRQIKTIAIRRGQTHSYDLLTEDAGYQIQGVPVNSMIEEMNAAAASGRLPER